ncbi:MAG: hypothetical protein ABJ034_13440 [Hyphomicrobiales bacterium]
MREDNSSLGKKSTVSATQPEPQPQPQPEDLDQQLSRPMTELIISLFRAQRRLEQGGDLERMVFMVQRHIDTAMGRLNEMGIELKAYDGQAYDPGMRAVTPTHFEAHPDVSRDTVGETTAPAIFLLGKMSSKSQAAILVPAPTKPEPKQAPKKAAKPKPKKAAKPRKPKAAPKNRSKS